VQKLEIVNVQKLEIVNVQDVQIENVQKLEIQLCFNLQLWEIEKPHANNSARWVCHY
jgi:hypothetical protein